MRKSIYLLLLIIAFLLPFDNFRNYYCEFYHGTRRPTCDESSPSAHNVFFEVAVSLGIPGFMIFLWLISALVSFFYQKTKGTKEFKSIICVSTFSSILIFLTYGLTASFLNFFNIMALFWLVIGLGVSATRMQDDSN
jgi:O-antigen ligase